MTDTAVFLAVRPDRLLPSEPSVRPVARRRYGAVRDVPVISPHGHVAPSVLLGDAQFVWLDLR